MDAGGFYASGEFQLDALPENVLVNAVELGRACIAKEHRNSRVLFLLWKVLANYLVIRKKRYLFGCCSVFTTNGEAAARVLWQLEGSGYRHEFLEVSPIEEKKILPAGFDPESFPPVDLPPLVQIYMRIGCKICGEPALDEQMGTVDFFMVFDLEEIKPRYRKLFFSDT